MAGIPPERLSERDHTRILHALIKNYPLLLIHPDFSTRLMQGDRPNWIECMNYMHELDLLDTDTKVSFDRVIALKADMNNFNPVIEANLQERIDDLERSLNRAREIGDIKRTLEMDKRMAITLNRGRLEFERGLDAGMRIINDGRSIYEDDPGSLSLTRDEKVMLAKKDVSGAVKGAITGGIGGALAGAGLGGLVGAAAGAIVGAISSSAEEATGKLFDKLRNKFTRFKRHH